LDKLTGQFEWKNTVLQLNYLNGLYE